MKLLDKIETFQWTSGMGRREFFRIGLLAVAATIVPHRVFAAIKELPPEKNISLHNVYTHENLEITFWKDGQYIPHALSKINHIFRDIRTGRVKEIDLELLNLLFHVRQKLKCEEPFHIISGYRTPKSNAILSKSKKGVAKNSLHMYGKAVDLRLPGCNLKEVRRTAMSFQAGGVGYYPRSKFIHVDVGQVRYWRG